METHRYTVRLQKWRHGSKRYHAMPGMERLFKTRDEAELSRKEWERSTPIYLNEGETGGLYIVMTCEPKEST
jgi:hypothetical protein